jgi:glycine cleavage system H protein
MNIPEDLKYTDQHEWIRVKGDHALVGITEFAQGELGDIVFVEVETVGETIGKGEVFGTIEAVKTVSDLFMPVTGEVVEFNTKLADNAELVNKDPYGEGWMISINIKNADELNELLTPARYKELINA